MLLLFWHVMVIDPREVVAESGWNEYIITQMMFCLYFTDNSPEEYYFRDDQLITAYLKCQFR